MRKLILKSFGLALAASCLSLNIIGKEAVNYYDGLVVAHRGCHFDNVIPENSVSAVELAAMFGYKSIECDVRYTLDSVLVIMHDGTINRTMRNAADYSEIKEPVEVGKTTFKELREKYVLASENPEFRKPIPALQDLLVVCRRLKIKPMLHSSIPASYRMAQEYMGDNWICFDADFEAIRQVRSFSSCLILWDPLDTPLPQVLERLSLLGGRCGVSSMRREVFTAEYIAGIRKAGFELQSSIWPTPLEVQAVHEGASIMLSDWFWSPDPAMQPVNVQEGKNEKLKKGEELNLIFSGAEFSGLTLSIEFVGTLQIVVNEKKTYLIEHKSMDSEFIGLRMYDSYPSIVIKTPSSAKISAFTASHYVM